MTANQITHDILLAYGSHPRLRLARANTGSGYPPGTPDRLVKFGVPGTADVVGILAPTGQLIMIEVKAGKDRIRKSQAVMQRVITSMGGLWCTAHSLDDVDRFMTTLGITR